MNVELVKIAVGETIERLMKLDDAEREEFFYQLGREVCTYCGKLLRTGERCYCRDDD